MIRHALAAILSFAAACLAAMDSMPGMAGLPDFGAAPTIASARSGAWSDPSTWSPARQPGAGDTVRISAGTSVTYDLVSDARLAVVLVDGRLAARIDVDTRLTVGTIFVTETGALEVGTEAAPVDEGHRAELVIADLPIDVASDPAQFGEGLVALGRVVMHGSPRRPAFVRLATEPQVGDSMLSFGAPVAWHAGDRLLLPDSRHLDENERGVDYVSQREMVRVSAVSADGRSVTLAAPLAFDHPGCHDEHGAASDLPVVADLTRTVMIRSENPAGTRGHVLFTHRAMIDVRWVGFRDLGRTTNADLDSTTFDADGMVTHIGTNQIGRYPLHAHHLIGPMAPPENGFQYTLIGNVIDGGDDDQQFKWGIAIHDSHYGVVHGNIVYNYQGAGLVTEDGSESRNLIDGNLVARVRGTGGRTDFGRDGVGFWLRGVNNWVTNNIATDIGGGIYCYGFSIFQYYLDDVTIPEGPGLEPTRVVDPHALPILGFDGNEAFGPVPNGMTYWWLGSFGGGTAFDRPNAPFSVIRNFRAWNYYQWGVFAYPSFRVIFDGMVLHGDYDLLARGHGSEGFVFSDYQGSDVFIRNSEFAGLSNGVHPSPIQSPGSLQGIEDCHFRCNTGIYTDTLWSVSAFGDGIPPRKEVVRGCTFDRTPYHGTTPFAIYRIYNGGTNPVQLDRLLVDRFQGAPGDAFEAFFDEQRLDAIVPQTTFNGDGSVQHPGCPEAGLTNAQSWAKYGIAIAGALLPSDAVSRDGIFGKVEAIQSSVVPTLPPTPSSQQPPSLPEDEAVAGSTGGGTGGGGGGSSCGLGGALGAMLAFALVGARRGRRS